MFVEFQVGDSVFNSKKKEYGKVTDVLDDAHIIYITDKGMEFKAHKKDCMTIANHPSKEFTVGLNVYNQKKDEVGVITHVDDTHVTYSGHNGSVEARKEDCVIVPEPRVQGEQLSLDIDGELTVAKDEADIAPMYVPTTPNDDHSYETEALKEFHEAFGYTRSDSPRALTADEAFKRMVFIQEEIIEFIAASCDSPEEFKDYHDKLLAKGFEAYEKEKGGVGEKDEVERIVAQADALSDINYFSFGTADMAGVKLLPIFMKVHEANMSKLDPETGKPIYNEFGKIQKGSGFKAPEPRIREEIRRQMSEDEEQ